MQRIHIKNQALFSSKDKSKKLKCCLLQFLFGALRVKQVSVRATEKLNLCGMNIVGFKCFFFFLWGNNNNRKKAII